jgi:hypothetical protein
MVWSESNLTQGQMRQIEIGNRPFRHVGDLKITTDDNGQPIGFFPQKDYWKADTTALNKSATVPSANSGLRQPKGPRSLFLRYQQ